MRFTTQRHDQKHNLMVTDSELLCNKESLATKVARSFSALSQSSPKDRFLVAGGALSLNFRTV